MKKLIITLLLSACLMGCVPALTEQVTTAGQTAGQETAEIPKTEMSADTEQALSVWQPWADIPLDDDFQEFLHDECEESNLAYSFIVALIATESNYKPDVISATNDYGLFQINICNHKTGVDYLDPYENAKHAIGMLENLSEKYFDVEAVLIAYNLGEGGAQNLWNQGIYSTEYSRKVLDKKIELERKHGRNL